MTVIVPIELVGGRFDGAQRVCVLEHGIPDRIWALSARDWYRLERDGAEPYLRADDREDGSLRYVHDPIAGRGGLTIDTREPIVA